MTDVLIWEKQRSEWCDHGGKDGNYGTPRPQTKECQQLLESGRDKEGNLP